MFGIDLGKMFEIVRIPAILLLALTCVGIILNFFNILILIIIWWVGVLGLCAASSVWIGHTSVKKHNLEIKQAGIAGTIVWLIPGTVGLTISGLIGFLNAYLWGAVEGYEIIAFLGGAVAIAVLVTIGAVIAFGLGSIGGMLAQKSK